MTNLLRRLEKIEALMAPRDQPQIEFQLVFVEAADGRPTGKVTLGRVIRVSTHAAAPPEESRRGGIEAAHGAEMKCPWCGSPDITPIEWHGPTGVVAPDGGREYQRQVGYKCLHCGEIGEV